MSQSTKYTNRSISSTLNVTYSVVQCYNTNVTFNLNQATFGTLIPITGNVEILDSGFSINNDGIEVDFTGRIKCSASIRSNSTVQRMAIEIRFLKNDEEFGPIGSSAYIRSINDHNHGSSYISSYIDVVPGDVIGITSRREGNAGTATMSIEGSVGDSVLIIERIEVVK